MLSAKWGVQIAGMIFQTHFSIVFDIIIVRPTGIKVNRSNRKKSNYTDFCLTALLSLPMVTLFLFYYFHQLNFEIQFFSCHFVIGIEGDGLFISVYHFYRKWLTHGIGEVNLLACFPTLESTVEAVASVVAAGCAGAGGAV